MRRCLNRTLSVLACHIGTRLDSVDRVWLPACLAVFWSALIFAADVPQAADQSGGADARQPATARADSTLRVGAIRLESHNIFSAPEISAARGLNRLLRRTMNALHVPTRPWVIRRELLLQRGERFDARLVAESERNLRALGILNRVAITPTDTTSDGRVDLVVRSHEAWTLSLGLSFALASSGDLRWNLALTERNFLGHGVFLQGVAGHDLDAHYGRLYLRQNRFLSTPLTFEGNWDERTDGHSRWLGLSVPFRTEAQAWSFSLRLLDRRYRTRWYLSNAGPAGMDPARWQSLYALLPLWSRLLRADVAWRVSEATRGRIWRLGAGLQIQDLDHDLGDGLFTLADGRRADLAFLAAPGQPLQRDRGREVWPHLILASQGRRWTQTRFLVRYGGLEDVPLDPAWELRIGPAGPAVGSTAGARDRWRLTLGASNWDRARDSFWMQRLSGFAVLGAPADRHHQFELLVGNYQRFETAGQPLTLKTFLEASTGDNLRGDQAPFLGLDRGLRTLDIDGMAGDRLLRWSTELGRTLPWVVLDIVQTGWGVFYNGGVASWRDEARGLADARHEIGAGLRFGSTRSGVSDLARLDVTYALTGRAQLVLTTVARGFF